MSRIGVRRFWLLGALVGIEGALVYVVGLGDLATEIPRFWLGMGAAFLAYGVVAWQWRQPALPLGAIVAAALLFRVTFLFSPVSLSDDIYRYIWEGRVQLAGYNPYHLAPAAAELAPLRNQYFAEINHKEISAIYPPLTQLFFRAVCAVDPSPLAMKVGFLLVEVGILLPLVLALKRRGRDPRQVILYAWNPLPIVEVAGNGHLDALGVLFLLLALYCLEAGRKGVAVWVLAGAVLSKLVPLMLVPLFWRHMGPEGAGAKRPHWLAWRSRLALVWLPLLVGLGFALFADGQVARLWSGFQVYLAKWRFNDGLFSVVYGLLKQPELAWDDWALLATKKIFAVLLLAVIGWTAVKWTDPWRGAFAALGTYLVLSPTLHPWYLLWTVPFLVLFPRLSWGVLSALVFLAYEVLIEYSKQGIWQEATWVKWVEFLPFYGLLALEMARRRFRSGLKTPG